MCFAIQMAFTYMTVTKGETMTNLIDTYLLKSGMPQDELCRIGRAKRAFYYYGMAAMGISAIILTVCGLIQIIG